MKKVAKLVLKYVSYRVRVRVYQALGRDVKCRIAAVRAQHVHVALREIAMQKLRQPS